MTGYPNPQVDRSLAVHGATEEHAIAVFLWAAKQDPSAVG
jgi:hypothetical protein